MPALHNRDRDTSDYRDQKDDDREISLGTGTILAIFFALALVCAAFFGLGYSMGRKSAQTPSIAAAADPAPNATFSGFKPPAGNPATPPATARRNPEAAPAPPADPDGEIVSTPVSSAEEPSASKRSAPPPSKDSGSEAPIVRESPRPAQAASSTVGQTSPMPVIDPNGTSMVQVAAVSHQEDADTLIVALKKRGYTVFIRQEPKDKLFHVQLGPFATKKDADAMRQHLLADGYNAIVK